MTAPSRVPPWVALATVLLASVACTDGGGGAPATTTAPPALPLEAADGEILFYAPVLDRLIPFDVSTRGERFAEQTDLPAYPFADRTDLVTLGPGPDDAYDLVELAADQAGSRVHSAPGEGLFPLASDGEDALLLSQTYDEEDLPALQRVVRLTGDQLTPIEHLEDLRIDAGTVLGDHLYFTTYVAATDTYDLARIPLRSPGAAEQLRTGLEGGAVYRFGDRLIAGGEVEGTDPPRTVDCGRLCFTPPGLRAMVGMVQVSPDIYRLSVFDPLTGRSFGTAEGPLLGFTVEGTEVQVWGDGLAETIAVVP